MLKKLILLILFTTLSALTNSDEKNLSNGDKDQIMQIISAIEYGWENGDGEPFRKYFLDFKGAKYFESGGQNIGLADLVENHVEPEKDALYFLELNFNNIDIFIAVSYTHLTLPTTIEV